MNDLPVRVEFSTLRDFIAAALRQLGMPDADALSVASLMAEADLQGSDGHGVIRLPQYARRIRAGGFNLHHAHGRVQVEAAGADTPRVLRQADDTVPVRTLQIRFSHQRCDAERVGVRHA